MKRLGWLVAARQVGNAWAVADDVFEIRGVDELYGMPLAGFVAARDALAKHLRSEGDRDAAAHVKRLAKPSVAAWALNQVVRGRPDEVAKLLDVGDEVRAHQAAAVEGGDPGPLREATRRRRALLQALVGPSIALAGGTHGEEVRTTLDVASLDDEGAPALRHGRLTGAVTAPGSFGFGFGFGDLGEPEDDAAPASPRAGRPASATEKAPAAAKATPTARGRGDAGARDAARREDVARRRAAEEAARSERARVERIARVTRLTEALDRANDGVVETEGQVRVARAALAEAEGALAAARRLADGVDAELAGAPPP